MLSFKQYIQKHPNGHRAKKTNRLSALRQIKRSLNPKLQEAGNPYINDKGDNTATLSKWDLIKIIADYDAETVAIELTGNGIYFDFVDVEIDQK